MTELTKPVRRVTTIRHWKGDTRVVVGLQPDYVTLREKGRQHGYTLPLASLWQWAAEREAERLAAEKKAKRRSA